MGSIKLDSHTPVYDPWAQGFFEQACQWADNYLSCTNRYAVLQNKTTDLICLQEKPKTMYRFLVVALKVMSFVSLVLPLIALPLKLYRKSVHDYHFISDEAMSFSSKEQQSARKQSVISEEVVVIEELPSQPQDEALENLKTRGMLTNTTVSSVISRLSKQGKGKPYYFTQYREITSLQSFTLIKNSKVPTAMKKPFPQEGGICIPIFDPTIKHFVGVFVDYQNKAIVYYDSLNLPLKKETKIFLEKLKKEQFKEPSKVVVKEINTCHQSDGINCGRYVIYFFTQMMGSKNLAKTIASFEKEVISSEEIYQKGLQWAKQLS